MQEIQDKKILQLKSELSHELTNNILSFWLERMHDSKYGGFHGRIDGTGKLINNSPKGSILNARILWAFSAASRRFNNIEYSRAAKRAYKYLIYNFIDKDFGGVYWMLDYSGNPLNTRKQIYAQAFAIYGLSEYFRATEDRESLEYAIRIFHLIEQHSFDTKKNGYLEAFDRKWEPVDDMRLSEKDINLEKTMNTHLHVLEAYTNLYRVWKDDLLRLRLKNLIEIFLEKIIDSETNHLLLFFDSDWNSHDKTVSYGHDIEVSWLLCEAADILGDRLLIENVNKQSNLIIKANDEGLQTDGSLIYEFNPVTGKQDTERHWWVQAEAVAGFYHHYLRSGREESLLKAINCWEYIKENLIDYKHGEWFWSILADGTPNRKDDKTGIWKCPYHNGRMCLEII